MPRPRFPATLLCATLTLATIGLWVQSYASPFGTQFWNVKRIALSSYRGHACLTCMRPPTPGTARVFARALNSPTANSTNTTIVPIVDTRFARLFSLAHYPDAHTVRRGWFTDVPYPILLIPTVALTGLAFVLDRRRLKPTRRRQAGLCPACGYDLRATPSQAPSAAPPHSHRRATRVSFLLVAGASRPRHSERSEESQPSHDQVPSLAPPPPTTPAVSHNSNLAPSEHRLPQTRTKI